mmetsp:Transcript_1900/g.4203  ORF Transcript_1900/g.4203 Transcript_1900/m.4203 type:complete len:233 (-) Transcript_1900:2535-3233(-)
MSRVIDQDVSVVSIFDLQQVADHGVGSERQHEVLTSFLVHPLAPPVPLLEVAAEVGLLCSSLPAAQLLLEPVQADGVGDDLDQPSVGRSREDLVRLQPHWEVRFLEDLLEESDKLHRELLLPQVVSALDDNGDQLPSDLGAMRAGRANPFFQLLPRLAQSVCQVVSIIHKLLAIRLRLKRRQPWVHTVPSRSNGLTSCCFARSLSISFLGCSRNVLLNATGIDLDRSSGVIG